MRLIDILAAGQIAGRVSALTDGSPLAAAAVTAYGEDGSESAGTSTEQDGSYLLGGLPAGVYRVEFSAAGFADAEVHNVEVAAGETTGGVDATLNSGP